LDELVVAGIKTSIPLHCRILDEPDFQRGDYTIHWLERFVAASGSASRAA
jgi:acetyl-CoA carboxylase, biotin carboxylase subunit